MALTLNGDDGIAGVNGSATTPAIQGTDTNTGLTFGTNEVNIVTDGTTRATVDSSGQLGIGTSSPQASLHIGNGTGNGVEIGNNGTLQVIDRGNSRIEPLTVTAEYAAFSIARNSSTTLHDERARFTYDGLTFNGDTAAANGLDDYEEGTWTPQLLCSGVTFSYNYNRGYYVKVGRLVYALWEVSVSGTSGSGAGVSGTGLPFTSGNSASNPNPGGWIHYSATMGDHPSVTEVGGATTTGWNILFKTAANGSYTSLQFSDIQTSTYMRGTQIYFANA